MSKKSRLTGGNEYGGSETVEGPGELKADVAPAERAPAKPVETKREKFLRLARRRVPKAEKAILHVANLFRAAQYGCEERHLLEVERLLQRALDRCRDNFVAVKPKAPAVELFPEDTAPPNSAG